MYNKAFAEDLMAHTAKYDAYARPAHKGLVIAALQNREICTNTPNFHVIVARVPVPFNDLVCSGRARRPQCGFKERAKTATDVAGRIFGGLEFVDSSHQEWV
jgi:hypothetical protein